MAWSFGAKRYDALRTSKRQALKQVFPDAVSSANDQMIIGHDGGLVDWLRRL
jgi:hypothetical protein